MTSEFKECILLELQYNDSLVLFGTFYRKGKSTINNNKLLRGIIDSTAEHYEKIILCGDFNFPTIK